MELAVGQKVDVTAGGLVNGGVNGEVRWPSITNFLSVSSD
jgi:hypothetical protein